MSDRRSRKKQPFRMWFPPWRSPPQASKQPKPLPIPSISPPASSPSSPQLGDDVAQLPSSLPSPLSQLTKVPSSSSLGRREVLPQADPARAQNDLEEFANELGKSDKQFTLKSLPQEERTETEFGPKQVTETEFGSTQVPKIEFESKQVTKTETSSTEPTFAQVTEEMKQGIDLEPQKDSEAQLENIQEEKHQVDSEAQQLQQEKGPRKMAESEQITEEFHSKEIETPKEEVSEEPKTINQPKVFIKVSDSMSPGGATEEETPEELKNGSLKEAKRENSAMKERKITISTMPNSSSHNLGQPSMQKELKDGLSRLAQKLSIGHQFKLGNEQGVNIITLASENQGASMFIGYEIYPGKKVGMSNETREEKYRNVRGNQPIASINSNVQGINSSILDETNYSERNPGVHMNIFTKPTVPVNFTGKTESQKAASSIISPQKLTYEPNIRRRCLRGLFLESSEDDTKNPQKPRRHGCRFTCDDKSKSEIEDAGTSRNI